MADLILGDPQRAISRLIAMYERRFPNAIMRALNRAGTSTRAVMASLSAKDLGLPVGTVREQMPIQKATPTRLLVRISTTGKRIPLIDFKARGPEPSRGKGRGVTARLPGGKGRYPHAFIAVMRSGHRGVFQRTGRARLPVVELKGPSLPRVFDKFAPQGLARGEEALRKNLAHELRFALSQSGEAA
jgi:hypothetical protein